MNSIGKGAVLAAERQRIWTSRPEILITTPESLFLMLQSKEELVVNLFSSVKTVIIDEVHALLNTRRGIQLAASLEWLAEFAGDFQRIALSATVKPAETAAAFAAGASARTTPPSPRPITIVECPNTRQLDVNACYPNRTQPSPTTIRGGVSRKSSVRISRPTIPRWFSATQETHARKSRRTSTTDSAIFSPFPTMDRCQRKSARPSKSA